MSTSLFEQLQRLKAPQIGAIADPKRRASILFDAKEAASKDRRTIYELGINGLQDLIVLNPNFQQFQQTLFDENTLQMERAVELKEVNDLLNQNIRKFLQHLSPYFLLRPTHLCLEWLVRRFQIQDYNRNELMALVLPYHETNIFVKVIQIFRLKESEKEWFWLKPLQRPGKPLAKSVIINKAATDKGFFKFICTTTLEAVKELGAQANLLQTHMNFYGSVVVGAFEATSIQEWHISTLLPSLIKGLSSNTIDFVSAAYIITARLVARTQITPKLCNVLISKVAHVQYERLQRTAVLLLIWIFDSQKSSEPDFKEETLLHLVQQKWLMPILSSLAKENVAIQALCIPLLSISVKAIQLQNKEFKEFQLFLENLLNEIEFPLNTAQEIISSFLDSYVASATADSPTKSAYQDGDVIELDSADDEEMPSADKSFQSWYSQYLHKLERQYPTAFDLAIKDLLSNENMENSSNRSKALKMALGYRLKSFDNASCDIYESLYHHTASIRLMAIKSLVKSLKDYQRRPQNYRLLKECLADRITDDSAEVVKEVLKLPTADLLEILGARNLVDALIAILYKIQINPEQWTALSSKVVRHLTNEQVIEQYDNNLILLAIMPLIFPIDSESTSCKAIEEIIKSPLASKLTFLQRLKLNTKNFSVADFKRNFLDVISEEHDTPTVTALFQSVQSQGDDYFKQAMQLYHFLMLVTACLKDSYTAKESLMIFKLIADYAKKFQIKHLEKHEWKIINTLRYIPLELFCDFVLTLSNHTDLKQLSAASWEDDSALELQYFLNIFEFIANECFGKEKNPNEQAEWSNILKKLFELTFKEHAVKATFLTNFYVYDNYAAVGNYTALRLKAFKIMQALFKHGDNLQLDVSHVLKIAIALLSSSKVLREEALTTLQVLLEKSPALDGNLKVFVKSLLERCEEISMDSDQLPLVLFALIRGAADGGKKQKNQMGSTILRSILNLIKQDERLQQACLTKQLMRLIVHIDDEEILMQLLPLAIRALELFTLDNSVKLLREPYISIFRLISERFNSGNIENVLTDCPQAWQLIELVFQSNAVFLAIEDTLKPVTCVFLECLDERALEKMPSSYKRQFLLLVIKTLAEAENDTIFLAVNKLLKKCALDCKPFREIIENMYKSCVEASQTKTPGKKRDVVRAPQVYVNGLDWKQGVVLMELLENKKNLQNTSALIPPLFELLNCCLAVEEQTTVEYTKQLILSGLLHCCQKTTDDGFDLKTTLPKTTFRMDQIVQCLRASQNPQTHHNALLLLSHCAAIFPQQVLHNIVDIFTFMGSSVVRHDDAFSFHIINDIIVSIVPILVKEKSAIIPVLKVFSDIMLDVPEHRRLPLYSKLLITLGSEQYLWMFLCVVFESHVIEDEKQRVLQKKTTKSSKSPNTDQVAKRIEIVLELTNTFAPQILMETCIQLTKYIEQLPMQKEDKTLSKSKINVDIAEASLFAVGTRSAKQLRHYKYVIMQFLSAITASNEFLKKIALLNNEVLQMKPYYQNFIIRILSYVPRVTAAIEKSDETSQQKFWKVILHHLHDVLDNAISLLSAEMFLVVVNGLMQHQLLSIRKKVIELLINKLQQKDSFFDNVNPEHFNNILQPLADIVSNILEGSLEHTQQSNELVFLQQTALIAIKLLSKFFAYKHIPEFKEILSTLTKITKQRLAISKIVLATVVLTMIEISSNLKAHSIAHLPKFMPQLLEVLQDQAELVRQQAPDNVCLAIVSGMQKLFETLPLFLGPYIVDIISALSSIGTRIKAQNNEKDQRSVSTLQKIQTIWTKIANEVPLRILVPSCEKAYAKLMSTRNYADISVLMQLLHQAITHGENKDLNAVRIELTGFFLQALEFRLQLKDAKQSLEIITKTETSIIDAFVAWVLKLSESAFRPLYHKLYNWALQQQPHQQEKILTYFLLTHKIAESLKSLFVLFASDFIEDAARLLVECNANKSEIAANAENQCTELLKAILNTLYNIFLYDSKEFVNGQRFEYLMPAIVDQLENRLVLEQESLQQVLSKCIAQLAVDVSNDVLWKQLNYQVLLKTRTGIPEVRILSFSCCVEIARKLGEDFTPLLPETVPFIAELFEDENPRVEKSTRKLVQELEVILGESLQKYL